MSFDKLVEEKIRAAMAAGEFDNLAGKGKPLDLTAYFATPEEVRVGYSLLKSAGFIPEEAHLLKEIESLKTRLATGKNDPPSCDGDLLAEVALAVRLPAGVFEFGSDHRPARLGLVH